MSRDSAKEKMLATIRDAIRDVPGGERPEDAPVEREYRVTMEQGTDQKAIADLFAERVADYRATIRRVSRSGLPGQISSSCRSQGVRNLVVPPGFPEEYLPGNLNLMLDGEDPLSHEALDRADGVVTTCRSAVAQTGTLILDGGRGQGRRALTLVPDYHLCIVREEQIVGIFPEAIRELEDSVVGEGVAVTLISGPSATSDIELNRVEGVHGPRRLEVIIVGD